MPREDAASTSSALLAQDVEILAVDADDDRVARPGQHLPDPLLEVGLHVAVEPGIAVDHLLDAASVSS